MLKVGLTGGIGSGKSTVAKVFKTLGIPVYYADKESKRIMQENHRLKTKIKNIFGESIYDDMKLNTKKLAEIVFKDSHMLNKLNNCVHPEVRLDFNEWVKKQNSPYLIEESALIFEAQIENRFDVIISVICPLEERINRIINRDNCTKTQVEVRIKTQITDAERKKKSDELLYNGSEDLLLPQIIKLDKKIRQIIKYK